MQLSHIHLGKLSVSPANMRGGRKPPDVADLLPTVRARGILVPLIVRPNGSPDNFEIVAGRRRFFAAQAVAEERREAGDAEGAAEPLPCAIMEAGDDAAALEASLIENVARMDAHEVEQWETFTRLVVKEGRKPQEIAATFGLTERQVKRVLALGNLLPGVRALYRKGEIDPATVRLLTMATKSQQKNWLAMVADPECYAPSGQQLKSWLFGGASIPTSAALFDLASYEGAVVADLFGEGGYFACPEAFWAAQRAAIGAKKAELIEAGWSEVVILDPGAYFNSWEYEKAPKRKGGRVYVACSPRGEVVFHEGYLTRREAEASRSGATDEAPAKPARSEVTGTMQTYIDLHRHAAVRADLVKAPTVALRLFAAHAIQGSYLFKVEPDPQRGGSEAVTESVETCAAETAFDAERRKALALLGFDEDTLHVLDGRDPDGTSGIFAKLLALSDAEVMFIIAILVGESLEAGSAVVDAAGAVLCTDMAEHFTADEAFFELLRDKEVLTAMVGELAGEAVARANAKEKAKVQKAVIRDCLAGDNGRAKVEAWVPRWLAFPPSAYTERGGVNAVRRAAEVADLFRPEDGPDGPAAPGGEVPALTVPAEDDLPVVEVVAEVPADEAADAAARERQAAEEGEPQRQAA